ncbi:MAG: phosphatidate cytidylyltransferase [Acutalibacteraceae bacterium]|jgi:phosphatidate cytidylyltransferase
MKQRVISGAVLVVVMLLVFLGIYTLVFGLFFSILSAIASYEILRVAKVENKEVLALSITFAFIVPLYIEYGFKVPFTIAILIFIFALLLIMLANYENTRFEQITVAIYSSVFIPFCFSAFILVRDLYRLFSAKIDKNHALFLVIIGVSCSWLTDTCAYFVGVKFGKRKMAPIISPKKSIEGAIGGIVGCLVLNMIILYLFNTYVFETSFISYLAFVPISLLLSGASMCGDLIASVIKRNFQAKDYGNLIPGHGGIMDRFDSCLFVMPMLYIVITIIYSV